LHLARCAVLFFIMVTGYYTNVEYDVLVRRAKKIFYLIVIATIIYLPLNILVHWAQGNMNFWLSEIQKPEILFKIIVLNWTTPIWGVGHLWYLFAFLYAFLIMALISRIFPIYKDRILIVWSTISLLIIFLIQVYSEITGEMIEPIYWRNSFFLIVPCFMIGNFLKKSNEKLKEISLATNVRLIILTIGIITLEHYALSVEYELYVSSILMGILIILISGKIDVDNKLTIVGRNLSQWIYIIHYVFIVILNQLTPKNIYMAIRPFMFVIVTIMSIGGSEIIFYFNKKVMEIR
jgi:surface polysaccharide O-acyltransferase-like enzyme